MFALFTLVTTTVVSQVQAAQPYSTWMADSAIARGQGHSSTWEYENGVFWRALEGLYNHTGQVKYYDWIKSGADSVVSDSGSIGGYVESDYQLDALRIGQTLIFLHRHTGTEKYKTAATTLLSDLGTHPRTAEGQFWHKQKYYNQGWLDGIYMADVFYANYYNTYNPPNSTAYADVVKQFTLIENHTRNATSGLLKHGYDYSKTASWADPVTGASPEVWDRALGWYAMALVDVLEYIPTCNAGHMTILKFYMRLMEALKRSADPSTGAWWLVMSQPGRDRNYIESSGSSMFAYALLKGIRLGYIHKSTYFATADKAYKYLVSAFVVKESNGTLGWTGTVQVGSLSGTGDYDYYVSVPTDKDDLKGLSPFIMASLEYERAQVSC